MNLLNKVLLSSLAVSMCFNLGFANDSATTKAKPMNLEIKKSEVKNQLVEYHDQTLSLDLSYNQINRLVLPSNIVSKIVSKENGVEIAIDKNQAFIKFSPIAKITRAGAQKDAAIIKNNNIYQVDKKVEVYFLTENKTYSFIFTPKKILSQTILVNDKKSKLESVHEKEKLLPFNTNMANLAKSIFENDNIIGYEKVDLKNQVLASNENINILATKKYLGYRYDVYELSIINKTNKGLSVEERTLIGLINKPTYAISIFYDNDIYEILPHNMVKAIVVVDSERK